MKNLPLLLFFGMMVFLTTSCQKDENNDKDPVDTALEDAILQSSDGKGKAYYLLPSENDLNSIPQDPKNPLTFEKIALGKLLFHETALAINPKKSGGMGTYSCGSCHIAEAGFAPYHVQAIGDGGVGFGIKGESREPSGLYRLDEIDVAPVRPPSAMNRAYQHLVFSNGQFGGTGLNAGTESLWQADGPTEVNHLGYEGLESQAIAALVGHRFGIDTSFLKEVGYMEMFDAAFADVPEEERYNVVTAGLAIGAYERTLLSNRAPFQKWLGGELDAMTNQEKRGALLFFGKAQCTSCHNGPALANMEFHAIGLNDLYMVPEKVYNVKEDDPAHLGRGGFTQNPQDNYKFKVGQLYNLADSPFYGHGSSFRSITDLIAYKNKGIAENPKVPADQLSEHFKPLGLTDEEVDDIAAFVSNALRDPEIRRYKPGSVLSGNCFPFNDMKAREEMGCN